MDQQTLPLHTKSDNAYIPRLASARLAFTREAQLWRVPTFLSRNLRAFLAHHHKAGKQQALAHSGSNTLGVVPRQADQTKSSIQLRSTTLSNGVVKSTEPNSDDAVPEKDAVSRDTLLVKSMDPNFAGPARRSVRHLQQNIYDDAEAELTLAPVSIRKKINFSHNRPGEDERPRKRPRTDQSVGRTLCRCSLTIWDNRGDQRAQGSADAIIRKNAECKVTWSRTEKHGIVVDIDVDEPFKIRAGDLRVPVDTQTDSTLRVLEDKYFMEFKIWPKRDDVLWPPIPLLGKSDGDVNRVNRPAHTVLQGSLVAKYNHLPRAPETNTPLSIFYLAPDGRNLRSKYGLEMRGGWKASQTPYSPSPLAHRLDWAVDDSLNLFGRSKPARNERHTRGLPQRKRQTKAVPPEAEIQPRLLFYWTPNEGDVHKAHTEFQTTTLEGLGCPACPLYTSKTLSELRFHFLTSHDRFNFSLEDDRYSDDERRRLVRARFKVETIPTSRSSPDRVFEYHANDTPFELSKYLDGDNDSWTGEKSVPTKDRGALSTASGNLSHLVPDDMIELRKQNDGHLHSSHVPDFRRAGRKKHRVVELIRCVDKYDQKLLTYDSIAHRQTFPSEDEMSETDDERDGEWYIQRHLENLDVSTNATKMDIQAELLRRWDRHRLEEKLDHIQYISESLVRFVRKHGAWLRTPNPVLRAAWSALLGDLLGHRLISAQVATEVHTMVYGGNRDGGLKMEETSDTPMLMNGVATEAVDHDQDHDRPPRTRDEALQTWHEHVSQVSTGHCGVCTGPVQDPPHLGVRCSSKECQTPTVWFHPKCVRLKERKVGWVCLGCRVQKAGNGEGKAV